MRTLLFFWVKEVLLSRKRWRVAVFKMFECSLCILMFCLLFPWLELPVMSLLIVLLVYLLILLIVVLRPEKIIVFSVKHQKKPYFFFAKTWNKASHSFSFSEGVLFEKWGKRWMVLQIERCRIYSNRKHPAFIIQPKNSGTNSFLTENKAVKVCNKCLLFSETYPNGYFLGRPLDDNFAFFKRDGIIQIVSKGEMLRIMPSGGEIFFSKKVVSPFWKQACYSELGTDFKRDFHAYDLENEFALVESVDNHWLLFEVFVADSCSVNVLRVDNLSQFEFLGDNQRVYQLKYDETFNVYRMC